MKFFRPLAAPVTPVQALTRIAWLLERNRQSSYRVEAFRTAARAAEDIGADELARRAADDTLTELGGIGKTTAAVIADATAGRLPDYLASLQDSTPEPPTGDAARLYDALCGDLHAHTDWSDGGSSIDELADAATALDQHWLTITDHSPRLTVANGLSAARLARQIDRIAEHNASSSGCRVLTGIEVDILDDGALDQSAELLHRLDIVTASVHSKLAMNTAPMTRRMVAAVRNPRVNVLGHCTGRRVEGGRPRKQSTFDAETVFTACRDHNTAVEINSRPERRDPPDDLIALARDLGCLFAIDSDAHAPGQLDFKVLGAERAARLGITADRIVTTWPADTVTDWARSS